MDYKVLYRKYRPDDFSSIIGQDYMISILKNSIKKEKISHAYIFSGPRGTGKTSTAKVFAKAINCLNPTENGPCNQCDSCLHFKENADIIEIDAASNNGVDEIREIINNIKLAPAYSKYKVYIIDEVHMLSTSAFNALLLTLEEPPKHVVFILATTNIEAVPITILSRAQRFDFHKITVDNILTRLKYVVNKENININDEALKEIAYISDGGLRDALSVLDQLSSNTTQITIDEVVAHFGTVSKKQIDDLFNQIVNNDVAKFVEMMHNFNNLSIDYKLLIRKLLEKIEEECIKNKSNNLYLGLDYSKLKNMAFELADISNYVNININPYQLIEITLLKYFNNGKSESKNISREIISTEKSNISQEIIPQNISREIISEEKINELCKIRVNNCFVNAKKEYLQNIKNVWPEFINKIEDKLLLNLVIDSNIVAASDKVIILTNKNEATVNLINQKLKQLEEKYNQEFKQQYKFIALFEKQWNYEKQSYINNLKNKIEYTYIEEQTKKTSTISNEKSLEDIAFDIFDKSKIEIE